MQMPGFLKWLMPKSDETIVPGQTDATKDQGVVERADEPFSKQENAPVAPWPAIDRYPTILGSNVSLAYISSVFRLSLTGYRREFCDLLDELLERDPHMYAVCAQRVHAVSGGETSFNVANCDESELERATEIRDFVKRCWDELPDRQQSISQLQWGGLYYGVGASEISWTQDVEKDKKGKSVPRWRPRRLHWIHSRRLAYPDPNNWSVRIWDMGMVASWDQARDPTGRMFGVACDEYPAKFIIHTPAVRGNYPTRDGLGRECAYWSALKLMGARGAAQYIERFGKPWVIAKYATGESEGEHRAAGKEDLVAVEAAARALGIGSLASAMIPDSTSIEIMGPAASTSPGRQLMHVLFVNMCNAEISKAVLGQTDTTEASPNGSRGAVEVRKQGTQELYRYDAACLSDTIQHDLVKWIVDLNFPGEEHLCPTVSIQAVEEPDLNAIVERARLMATVGAPVDADALADEVGVKLIERKKGEGDQQPRRLYNQAPLKLLDPNEEFEMGPEKPEPPKLPGMGTLGTKPKAKTTKPKPKSASAG